MNEIAGLHELGLVSSFDDYVALPWPVLKDARLVMETRPRPESPKTGGSHGGVR